MSFDSSVVHVVVSGTSQPVSQWSSVLAFAVRHPSLCHRLAPITLSARAPPPMQSSHHQQHGGGSKSPKEQASRRAAPTEIIDLLPVTELQGAVFLKPSEASPTRRRCTPERRCGSLCCSASNFSYQRRIGLQHFSLQLDNWTSTLKSSQTSQRTKARQ